MLEGRPRSSTKRPRGASWSGWGRTSGQGRQRTT